jgi:hypothetical protein
LLTSRWTLQRRGAQVLIAAVRSWTRDAAWSRAEGHSGLCRNALLSNEMRFVALFRTVVRHAACNESGRTQHIA